MANFYPYLISSLPMLHFTARPPFSFEKFLHICKGLMPDEDFKVISNLPHAGGKISYGGDRPVIKRWLEFETALRNELVKVRAARKHADPSRYMRPDGYGSQLVAHIALTAQRNPSILEGEKFLDRERWKFLDELAAGHYFDADTLIIYAYKLLIMERWERINTANHAALLEDALQI